MIKKITILFTVVVGLILSVTYVVSGSAIGASQSLPELPDRSAAVSDLSGSYHALMAVDPCDVDFNGNGVVDVDDIMEVANCWRSTDPADIALYDLDGDEIVTIADIMLVAAQWGNTCGTPTPTPTSTPTLTSTPTPTATPTSTPTSTPTNTSTPTTTPSPGTPVPPLTVPGLAIDMGGQDTDPTRRNLAAAAGFRLHRTSVSWASIEPTNVDLTNPANGNWPDSTFNVYRNDRRLIPYVIVMNNPSWAVTEQACGPIKSSCLDDFGEFVYQLVSRYADVTPYWAFYNEEDQWTTPYVGHNAGGCWGGNGAEYAQMLAVAWDAAHSANPNAQVIFGAAAYEPVMDGGATWDRFFFRDAFEYMEDHPDDYVDIILANQYNAFRDDWDGASITSPENQEIIAKFRQAVSDASFNSSTPGAYSIYKWQTEYGLNTPMATGEVGLQVSVGPVDVPTMEELQARHAVHVNVRGMAAGLKIICWYTLVDKGGGELNYGLLHGNLTPRPAYAAYPVLAQQLDGYEFDQQLVVSGKPMIQAYRFDQGGDKKLVLWRDDGQKIKKQSTTATETMTISATELGAGWTGRVRVTDKLGSVSTYGSPGAPSVSLTFSSDPIYVEAY